MLLRILGDDRRDLWCRAAEKAVRFVASATGCSAHDVNRWLDDVEQAIKQASP